MNIKTNKILKIIVILNLSSICLADEGERLVTEIKADFFSKYIWRGQNINDDYVLQPSATASVNGFSFAIWGSYDFTGISGNAGEFTEVESWIEYSDSINGLDGLEYIIGVINYHFPSVVGDTTELYWGLSLPEMPFSPSVTVYHDIDVADGTYVSLGGSYSIEKLFELTESMPVGMDLGASIGWGDSDYNNAYWGISDGKVNDLTLSLSFPMQFCNWTFAPSLNYVTLLSDDVRQSDSFRKESDYFFTGLSLSTEF